MFNLSFALNRNAFHNFKYLTYTNRYYRTKYRKKVSIELNKPSLYEDRRTTPSKLLKANLFTPESAGYRELSMLCFWIVNYGYADYSILSRYVQCAIQNIKKLKIKSIALIFHSVSKYLYDNGITLIEPKQIEDYEEENKGRQMLIVRCVQMILESSTLLPNLFVNAVPKDLGMIALSIMNIYQMFINECNVDSVNIGKVDANSSEKTLKDTTLQSENLKTIGQKVNKLLQRLSQEIIPKMAFCELDEFAAFAKAFSKVNTDWSNQLMRELSHEASSLLMEKIEDLEMLAKDKFIGEDLIEQLNKIPRDLSTITCSLASCKLNENKFWERSNRLMSLLLELKDQNKGIKEVELTTLTLLCTSMSKSVDVTKIVDQMLKLASSEDHSAILVGFNTSISRLKHETMANKFLKKLNTKELVNMNTRLVSEFIFNFARSGLTGNTEVRDEIVSLLDGDLEERILCSIYMAKNQLNVPFNTVVALSKRLSSNLNIVETMTLVNILFSSVEPQATNIGATDGINDQIKSMCNQVIQVLSTRVEKIQIRMILPLLSLVLKNFSGNLGFINRLCRKIDDNFSDFDTLEIARVTGEMSAMGLNVNKLFNKNIMKIRESADAELANDSIYSIDAVHSNDESKDIPYIADDDYDVSNPSPSKPCDYSNKKEHIRGVEFEDSDKNADYEAERINRAIDFSKNDKNEIAVIARCTLTKAESVSMINADDFQDEYYEDETFELTKYPLDNKEGTLNGGNMGESIQSRSLKAVTRSSTVEQLKSEWSNLRQTAQ